MTTSERRPTIEVLDPDTCWRLLATDEVGRLALVIGGTPTLFPVNYVLDGTSIVFRTDPGTKLDHVGRSRAAFEVDDIDRARRSGWSVVATGRLEELTHYDAAALERAKELPIDPWAGGERTHWVRLVAERVTGRRVTGTP
jgi:nitroimidazol reductase NimA-like FMN-containing flavoprotein (pyridoxamine 5'-phosphate oxidase superfamily)